MFDTIKSLFKYERSEGALFDDSTGIKIQSQKEERHSLLNPNLEPHVVVKPKANVSHTLSTNIVKNTGSSVDEVRLAPRSGHKNDNMNYYHFAGTALYLKTNRQRKVNLDAFNESSAVEKLVTDGYERNSIDIHIEPFDDPTPDQLRAMDEHDDYLPSPACKYDVSYLIDRYMNDDVNSDIEVLRFATSRGIMLSYYLGVGRSFCFDLGQSELHKMIWYDLDEKERIAYFICNVSADAGKGWQLNRFDEFMALADKLSADSSFMKSYKQYYSNDFDGLKGWNSSRYRQRLCYTKVLEYL